MKIAEVLQMERIVVVGGGLAASRSCAALRRQGHDGDVVLIAAEPHLPYDRPPLSKGMLHGTCTDPTLPADLIGLGVQIQLGTAATGLLPGERTVTTVSGEVTYDGLVIATGARPVRLPGDGEQLLLRTVDDARVLRDRLVPDARIVVIGASWIGAEVVTAAITAGCRVTCLEVGPGPAAQVFGAEVAERFMPWWEGVDLRCGTSVARVECAGVTGAATARLGFPQAGGYLGQDCIEECPEDRIYAGGPMMYIHPTSAWQSSAPGDLPT